MVGSAVRTLSVGTVSWNCQLELSVGMRHFLLELCSCKMITALMSPSFLPSILRWFHYSESLLADVDSEETVNNASCEFQRTECELWTLEVSNSCREAQVLSDRSDTSTEEYQRRYRTDKELTIDLFNRYIEHPESSSFLSWLIEPALLFMSLVSITTSAFTCCYNACLAGGQETGLTSSWRPLPAWTFGS